MMTLGNISKLCYLFLIILFFSCNSNNKIKINGYIMGTTYEITIDDFNSNSSELKDDVDKLLKDINSIFSTYEIDSEISFINNFKENKNIKISGEFLEVISKSLYYCDLSNGSYDITVAPLVELWGFGKNKEQVIPTQNIINEKLEQIGYENILIDNQLLRKKNSLLSIDLNSIAKGYAVDEVYNMLIRKGYKNFLVEIGGELRSSSVDGYSWLIGIANPLSNSIINKIELNNFSMATSGTYNNYFIHDDKKYSHIINPKNGYPYQYELISATIISEECADADALATMALTMPVDIFLNIINSLDDTECYLVAVDTENNLFYKESDNFSSFID